MKRRNFLKGLAATGVLTGLYTWQIEPFWVQYVEVDMPIENLPNELEGKMLMQISDIHVGTRFDWKYLIKEFKEAQLKQPDIVVYTGDFVSYESVQQLKDLQIVLESAVKGSLDTVAILGNHDYGKNWNEPAVANKIVTLLEEVGITTLRNQKKEIEGLNIIGIDDYWGTNFYPENIMPTVDASAANLVLCHNPDVADIDVWSNYKGWILAGHTHGGQCKPPFLPPPMLPIKNKAYAAGKVPLKDGRTLYINRALGHLWQVRFNVRPEITLFTLHKK